MTDDERAQLEADLRVLVDKIATPEAEERMRKFSPEARQRVIEATADVLAKYFVIREKKLRMH